MAVVNIVSAVALADAANNSNVATQVPTFANYRVRLLNSPDEVGRLLQRMGFIDTDASRDAIISFITSVAATTKQQIEARIRKSAVLKLYKQQILSETHREHVEQKCGTALIALKYVEKTKNRVSDAECQECWEYCGTLIPSQSNFLKCCQFYNDITTVNQNEDLAEAICSIGCNLISKLHSVDAVLDFKALRELDMAKPLLNEIRKAGREASEALALQNIKSAKQSVESQKAESEKEKQGERDGSSIVGPLLDTVHTDGGAKAGQEVGGAGAGEEPNRKEHSILNQNEVRDPYFRLATKIKEKANLSSKLEKPKVPEKNKKEEGRKDSKKQKKEKSKNNKRKRDASAGSVPPMKKSKVDDESKPDSPKACDAAKPDEVEVDIRKSVSFSDSSKTVYVAPPPRKYRPLEIPDFIPAKPFDIPRAPMSRSAGRDAKWYLAFVSSGAARSQQLADKKSRALEKTQRAARQAAEAIEQYVEHHPHLNPLLATNAEQGTPSFNSAKRDYMDDDMSTPEDVVRPEELEDDLLASPLDPRLPLLRGSTIASKNATAVDNSNANTKSSRVGDIVDIDDIKHPGGLNCMSNGSLKSALAFANRKNQTPKRSAGTGGDAESNASKKPVVPVVLINEAVLTVPKSNTSDAAPTTSKKMGKTLRLMVSAIELIMKESRTLTPRLGFSFLAEQVWSDLPDAQYLFPSFEYNDLVSAVYYNDREIGNGSLAQVQRLLRRVEEYPGLKLQEAREIALLQNLVDILNSVSGTWKWQKTFIEKNYAHAAALKPIIGKVKAVADKEMASFLLFMSNAARDGSCQHWTLHTGMEVDLHSPVEVQAVYKLLLKLQSLGTTQFTPDARNEVKELYTKAVDSILSATLKGYVYTVFGNWVELLVGDELKALLDCNEPKKVREMASSGKLADLKEFGFCSKGKELAVKIVKHVDSLERAFTAKGRAVSVVKQANTQKSDKNKTKKQLEMIEWSESDGNLDENKDVVGISDNENSDSADGSDSGEDDEDSGSEDSVNDDEESLSGDEKGSDK